MLKKIKLFAILTLLFCLIGCNVVSNQQTADISQDTLAKLQATKKLRVAYIHYPPSAYKDPKTNKVSGLFVDILEEMVRQIDPSIIIEYEETTWADFSTSLNTKRVDLSIAGTFTTIPRAKVVAFTQPIVLLGRSAIVKKNDARFSSEKSVMQFDRPDIKIGVVSGEGSHEYVQANFKNQANIVVFSGSDLSQCLAAVSAGQVDVGLSDALETQKYAKAHAEVADLYVNNPYNLTPIAWSVRPNDQIWLNFLNTALTTFTTQGKIAEWESKYDFKWAH